MEKGDIVTDIQNSGAMVRWGDINLYSYPEPRCIYCVQQVGEMSLSQQKVSMYKQFQAVKQLEDEVAVVIWVDISQTFLSTQAWARGQLHCFQPYGVSRKLGKILMDLRH